MKATRITTAIIGAILLIGGVAGTASAVVPMESRGGNYDCTALQRQVTSTGTAQTYIYVMAGTKADWFNGSSGPHTRTAYSGLLKTTWKADGSPSLISAGGGCSIK